MFGISMGRARWALFKYINTKKGIGLTSGLSMKPVVKAQQTLIHITLLPIIRALVSAYGQQTRMAYGNGLQVVVL
jgi:hypothetical protein